MNIFGAVRKERFIKSKNKMEIIKTVFTVERTIRYALLSKKEKDEIYSLERKREIFIRNLPDITISHKIYLDKKGQERYGRIYPDQKPQRISQNTPLIKWVLRSSIPHSYGILLYLLISRLNKVAILELGTGIGVSTLYLLEAMKRTGGNLDSIEIWDAIAKLHMSLFKGHSNKKYNFFHARSQDVLSTLLQSKRSLDFVFHDGSHQYKDVLADMRIIMRLLKPAGIVVFDDINISTQMQAAWKEISLMQGVIYATTITAGDNKFPKMGLIVRGS